MGRRAVDVGDFDVEPGKLEVVKPGKTNREHVLEGLLQNLLNEVESKDANGQKTDRWCAGCQGKSRPIRACVAAREYLKRAGA